MRDHCAFVCINVCNGWGGAPPGVRVTRSKIRAFVLRVDRRMRVSYAHFRLRLIFISSFRLSFSSILNCVPSRTLPPPPTTRFVLLFHYFISSSIRFKEKPWEGDRWCTHYAPLPRMCVHHALHTSNMHMYANEYTPHIRLTHNCIALFISSLLHLILILFLGQVRKSNGH